ncbi:MAG: YdcF family protein [Caldilineaceae bacterium]
MTTGGYVGDRLSAAAVARRKAIEWGVPAARIFLADGGQTTGEDARATAVAMANYGWHSATLVSHPLHLYRSRWHFQRAGIPEVYTYAAGNRERLPGWARVYLSSREAFGVVWAAVDGWKRFAPLGHFLEGLVYGRRGL